MQKATDTDRRDFVEVMTALNPTIGQYVAEIMAKPNADPRGTHAAFETAANVARDWCVGRFGKD